MKTEDTASNAAQWLAPEDEANLVLDHPGQVNVFLAAMVVSHGGFVDADGNANLAELRSIIRERVGELPVLRRIPAPAGRRHRWAEKAPNLDHHIRFAEPINAIDGLERMCARLMTTPLPLDRPLWELLVVPVSGGERVGVILRLHHAIADGMAAVDIAERLFDSAPAVRTSTSTSTTPDSSPAAAADQGVHRRARIRDAIGKTLFGLERVTLALGGSGVGQTMLLGERGPHRVVAFDDVDLAALVAAVKPRGATINDALLDAVASGYRAAFRSAGETVPPSLTVSVPVALPRDGSSRNHVGVMLVRLPLDVPAADDRLRFIAGQTRVEKLRARHQGTLEVMRGPIGARVMEWRAKDQHLIAGFVTDVPGPAKTRSLAGAPIVAIWPVTVLAANVRLGVAAVSYAGRLHYSTHFDADHVPGAAFARAMTEEFDRLTLRRPS